MIQVLTNSPDDTFRLAESFAPYCLPKTVFLLDGDLAAGKTVFAKGLGKGLSVESHIKSPTYTLLCSYEGRLPFYHFDAYRLSDGNEFLDCGFDEYLFGDGVTLIEWAEIISDLDLKEYIKIKIRCGEDENQRIIEIETFGEFHSKILEEWQKNEASCF